MTRMMRALRRSRSGLDPTGPGKARITFRITLPADTPQNPEVWIQGNEPPLGGWDARGLEALSRGDEVYVAVATFPLDTSIEFKVTRGGWDTVERSREGEEIANRRHLVTGPATLDIEIGSWRDRILEAPQRSSLTGDVRFHRCVRSASLGNTRDVAVYIPPGYAKDDYRRYPVLYVQDGQNLFDAKTSFLGVEWGVDETAERLIETGRIEPLIVVGVYNTSDRLAEYTPVVDIAGRGGDADRYGRFLVNELKPRIDATYRTLPGREHTGLAGSSLGGLVSMYLGLALPRVFSRIGALSPSVWWANHRLLRLTQEGSKLDTRIWLDIGTRESGSPARGSRMVESVRGVRDALLGRGWILDRDLHYLEATGAGHDEDAWSRRVGPMLEFLFPPRGAGAPGEESA